MSDRYVAPSLYEPNDRDMLVNLLAVLDAQDKEEHDAGNCAGVAGGCRSCTPSPPRHRPRHRAPEQTFRPRFVALQDPST